MGKALTLAGELDEAEEAYRLGIVEVRCSVLLHACFVPVPDIVVAPYGDSSYCLSYCRKGQRKPEVLDYNLSRLFFSNFTLRRVTS